eukprot:5706262-Ditylum_brightwellii.AAC.1
MWGRLIWTTGGLLEFTKSYYFLLAWMFTPEGHPMVVKEKDLPFNTVEVTNVKGTSTKLARVSAGKEVKMLGIHKAATLDKTTEYQYLKSKVIACIQAMNACPIPPHEA